MHTPQLQSLTVPSPFVAVITEYSDPSCPCLLQPCLTRRERMSTVRRYSPPPRPGLPVIRGVGSGQVVVFVLPAAPDG